MTLFMIHCTYNAALYHRWLWRSIRNSIWINEHSRGIHTNSSILLQVLPKILGRVLSEQWNY
jgi:hypothetical protein